MLKVVPFGSAAASSWPVSSRIARTAVSRLALALFFGTPLSVPATVPVLAAAPAGTASAAARATKTSSERIEWLKGEAERGVAQRRRNGRQPQVWAAAPLGCLRPTDRRGYVAS